MPIPYRNPFFFARALFGFVVFFNISSSWQLPAQETLPSIDGSFLLPDAGSKKGSPFGDDESVNLSRELRSTDLAAKNSGALNSLFSHQWVHTNSSGGLEGSVVTLVGEDTLSVSGLNVILAQRGQVVSKVESNSNGGFVFENVQPGYYSIIAEADNSFATFGLAVMSNESGGHLPSAVEIRVIRPKGESIRRIMNVDMIPAKMSYTGVRVVRDPILAKRAFSKSHRVLSTKDGKVVGHLSQLGIAPELEVMSQMKAMLLKDGVEIARANVAANGAFEFQNVEPGCYGFAAAGNKGIAAVAFCVIKPDSLTRLKSKEGASFVSANQDTAVSQLNVELADNSDVMSIRDQTTTENKEEVAAVEQPPAQPMPIGGSNMFGAGQIIPGGSGGSGIGGVLKDLLGLGAIAGIAYVVGKEIDKDNKVVSPVTR